MHKDYKDLSISFIKLLPLIVYTCSPLLSLLVFMLTFVISDDLAAFSRQLPGGTPSSVTRYTETFGTLFGSHKPVNPPVLFWSVYSI